MKYFIKLFIPLFACYLLGLFVVRAQARNQSTPAPYYIMCGETANGSWIMVHPDCCLSDFTIVEGCRVLLGSEMRP